MSIFPSRLPFRCALRLCAGLCCAALTLAGLLSAQEPAPAVAPGIPRFELPTSGLEWKAPVHPLKFFDATGHRAGVFGKQTGQYEAWIYPIKVLHGLRLEFRQEGMPEPVRGEAYLEQIIARPESTTLVYVHPRFTVRQVIWTPLDEPAIVNFFDVDSDKPLAITVKFVPDFKPMWPASLGGQYTYWMAEEKAFGITDGTSKPTALVGSPSVGAFTEHMDHSMVGCEMLLQLRVEPEQARKTIPALVMALNMESAKKAREIYSNVLGHARELYEARVKYHRDFLARTLTIETPDAELNRAFTWAKVAIDAGWVCHEKMGCGLVAGYGPAGDYERPGFAWWFGGDALMASWAMLDYGDTPGALQVLRFLKARQRADGKTMHEMTQSVDLVDWFGKYGFAYYHADTTPMYIYSVAEYWRRTGDKKFLEEFWPSVKKAYEYCLTTVDPADGLMDNTKAGLAAVEVGPLRGKVTKDIYLEGFWLGGLEAMKLMALGMDDHQLAGDVRALRTKAAASLTTSWWNPKNGTFPFGVDQNGKRAERLGAWPAVLGALQYPDQRKPPFELSAEEGKLGFATSRQADSFSAPELSTDWGIRWLSNKDGLYDPLSYNNGTVWPFISGFVAWAQYKATQPLAGYATLTSLSQVTGLQSPGAMPEHMVGDRNRPGERSVPHQLFSSWGVVVPAVRGLLGMEMVASDGDSEQPSLRFAPQVPVDWPLVRFSHFSVGASHVSGEIRQQPNRMTLVVQFEGTPVPLEFFARLPKGKLKQVIVNGKPVNILNPKLEVLWGSIEYSLMGLHITAPAAQRAEVVIEYEGAVGIVPVTPKSDPGAKTAALKVLEVNDWRNEKDERRGEIGLAVAGLAGRMYTLDLVTTVANLTAEGAAVEKTQNGYRLEISFEGPENEYVTRQIRLRW
jgi:hypothetical protein